MIFYNVWFSFKEDLDESEEIQKLHHFLADFKRRSMIHEYRLMKNRVSKQKSTLLKYHVVIEFGDDSQFEPPFAEIAQIGIHSGLHGAMIENVSDFLVEVFEDII